MVLLCECGLSDQDGQNSKKNTVKDLVYFFVEDCSSYVFMLSEQVLSLKELVENYTPAMLIGFEAITTSRTTPQKQMVPHTERTKHLDLQMFSRGN